MAWLVTGPFEDTRALLIGDLILKQGSMRVARRRGGEGMGGYLAWAVPWGASSQRASISLNGAACKLPARFEAVRLLSAAPAHDSSMASHQP